MLKLNKKGTKNYREFNKAIEQLEVAQERARTRTFEEYELEKIIEKANNLLEVELKQWSKKYLQGVTFKAEHTVSNAYKYSANTTIIEGNINKYGNIQRINIYRGNASKGQGYSKNINIEPVFI